MPKIKIKIKIKLMNKYDVFINGIHPDYNTNKEQVSKKASNCLKISIQQVEKLLNSPNTRLRQSVSEIKAQQYKKILCQIGIICFYTPSDSEDKILKQPKIITKPPICPNCSHQLSLTNKGTLPEECDKCGIFIELFLKHHTKNDNPQQHSPQTQKKQTARVHISQNNGIDKPLSSQEMSLDTPPKVEEKKFKSPTPYVTTAIVITLLAVVFYAFSNSDKPPTVTTTTIPEDNPTTSNASQKVIPSLKITKTQHSIPDKKNHSSQHPLTTKNEKTIPQSDNPFEQTALSQESKSSSEDSIKTTSNTLLNFAVDNEEWDTFLIQKIDNSISNKNFKQSYQLIACLSEPEKQIGALAKLLLATREKTLKNDFLTKMENIIKSSPAEIQPQLLSQTGRYQIDLQKKKELYNRAEKSLNLLSDPVKQLSATLSIAASYFKNNDIESSNYYLMKLTSLLKKISINDVDNQIKSRVEIGKTYKDTDNIKVALPWIKDSEILIKQAGESAIHDLVEGYVHLDQHVSVIRLVKEASSVNKRDARAYKAIRSYLSSGQVERAIKLNRSIQGAAYRALSYILIATYSEENQNYSILAESILNSEISAPSDKAVISSRLAQLYARQHNTYKTEKQLQITKQQINTIPSSPEKDRLLNIVATNYARSLMFKPAATFISAAQSSDVKSQFNQAYINLTKLTTL